LGQTGCLVVLGNSKITAFWQDRWRGDCAQKSQYHHLFNCAQIPLFQYKM
jgi:hypothetical protein